MNNNMNQCENIRLLLPDYLDNKLPPEEVSVIKKHLHDCNVCREAIFQLQKVSALMIEAWPDISPGAEFLPALNSRIDDLARPWLVRLARRPYFYPAVAAAVILVIFTAWMVIKSPPAPTIPVDIARKPATTEPKPDDRMTHNDVQPQPDNQPIIVQPLPPPEDIKPKPPDVVHDKPEPDPRAGGLTSKKPPEQVVTDTPPKDDAQISNIPPTLQWTVQSGQVWVRSKHQYDEWSELAVSIQEGDTLKTTSQPALLALSDGSTMQLNKKTTVTMQSGADKTSPGAEPPVRTYRGNVMLQSGAIRLAVAANKQPFAVQTPSGRINVTGTQLEVVHQRYFNTNLREYVELRRQGKSRKDMEKELTLVALASGNAEIADDNLVSKPAQPSSIAITAGERVVFGTDINPTKLVLPAVLTSDKPVDIPQLVNYLLDLLGKYDEQNEFENAMMIEALLQSYGQSAVPHLMTLLRAGPDENIAIEHYHPDYVSRILGRLGDEGLYDDLKAIVSSDIYREDNRQAAAGAIIWINQTAGGQLILDLYKSSADNITKRICLAALKYWDGLGARTNGEFVRILAEIIRTRSVSGVPNGASGQEVSGTDLRLFDTAITSLASINDPAVADVLNGILKTESDYRIIIPVSRSLFMSEGKDAYPKLRPRLYALAQDKDDLVKISAMKSIMDMEGPAGQKRFIQQIPQIAMKNSDITAKVAALDTMLYFKGVEAIEFIKNILTASPADMKLRTTVVQIISQAGDNISVELLAQLARWATERAKKGRGNQFDSDTASLCADAIKETRNARARPAVLKLLNDTNPELVISAVIALRAVGDKADAPALVRLKSNDAALRKEIDTTAKRLKDQIEPLQLIQ